MAVDWGADIVRRAIVSNQNQKKNVYPLGIQTALSSISAELFSGSVKDYAIFGGGSSTFSTTIAFANAYTADLVRSILPNLSATRKLGASAYSQKNCLFAGGIGNGTTDTKLLVECFDNNLTRTVLAAMQSGRMNLAGAYNGNYYIFAGGRANYSTLTGQTLTDAYDSNLVKVTAPSLYAATYYNRAVKLGNKALFVGGTNNNVDVYIVNVLDENLTISLGPDLAISVRKAVHNDNFAFFNGSDISVEKIDKNIVKTNASSLSTFRHNIGICPTAEFAFFAGGETGINETEVMYNVVETYDSNAVMEIRAPLSESRSLLGGANVGNKVIFAGGDKKSAYSAVADAYEIK